MLYLNQDSHKLISVSSPPVLKKDDSGSGAKMPKKLQNGFEQMSGISFENVRIHYASKRPASLNALAYAQGSHVYLGPGQERHLPHELGHVLQQKQGRVQPTMQIGGMQVNRDASLEREADMLGYQAQRYKVSEEAVQPYMGSGKTVLSRAGSKEAGLHMRGGQAAQLRIEGEESAVAQLEGHVQYGEERALAVPEGVHPANPPINHDNPTIYYESFGDDKTLLLNIYTQSCTYPGRTVCILGLNQKSAAPPDASLQGELISLEDAIRHVYKEGHDAYLIPFTWKETADEGGYTFPYFEVRGKLMQVAENLAGERPEEKALFRWIDRDAVNDKPVRRKKLRELADDDYAAVYTGVYDWETDQWAGGIEGDSMEGFLRKKKLAFFSELNKCERELRAYFWSLHRRLDQHGREKFYLPEPTLLMNLSAHQIMKSNLEQELRARRRRGNANAGQQRESWVALGGRNNVVIGPGRQGTKIRVTYRKDLSVTKPNKTITLPGGRSTRYLQNVEELIQNGYNERKVCRISFPDLVTALKNLRQSAFDDGQWSFLGNADSARWELQDEGVKIERRSYTAEELQAALNWKRVELARRLYNILM